MTITAIKQQERLKGRYSIYIDTKYAFSLSADALLAEGLHPGMAVDDAALEAYKKLSADDKAYNLALAYIMRRMRSRYEFVQYCKRKEIDEDLTTEILTKLEGLGLIDDYKFAEAWVCNRRLLKPTSTRKLAQELRAKRVADHVIEQVLSEDDTDERSVLKEMITKKRKQLRYQDDMKLMRYLAGQGFSYDDIKSALAYED